MPNTLKIHLSTLGLLLFSMQSIASAQSPSPSAPERIGVTTDCYRCMVQAIRTYVENNPMVAYPIDGCAIRAADFANLFNDTCIKRLLQRPYQPSPCEGITLKQVYLCAPPGTAMGGPQFSPAPGVRWACHTASIFEDNSKPPKRWVLDPSLADRPVPLQSWQQTCQSCGGCGCAPICTISSCRGATYGPDPRNPNEASPTESILTYRRCTLNCLGAENRSLLNCQGLTSTPILPGERLKTAAEIEEDKNQCIRNTRNTCKTCHERCDLAYWGRFGSKPDAEQICLGIPDEGYLLRPTGNGCPERDLESGQIETTDSSNKKCYCKCKHQETGTYIYARRTEVRENYILYSHNHEFPAPRGIGKTCRDLDTNSLSCSGISDNRENRSGKPIDCQESMRPDYQARQ